MAGLATAADELEALAYRLRLAGQDDLLRELGNAFRDAVKPVQAEIRAGLKPKLPDRYAEVLDGELVLSVKVRTGERNPGVTLTGTTRGTAERRRIRRLDQGILAHPLWGRRKHWRNQGLPSVQPGWFTGPAEGAGGPMRAELERALEDVANRAAGK